MANLGRIGVIVAARTGSTRLPGKVLLPLSGIPMITFLLRRLRGSRRAQAFILATTGLAEDDRLAEIVAAEGVPVFRGSNEDLLERFVAATARHDLDTVVRVTGDCPFVDAETLDHCLSRCAELDAFDIATTKGAFPQGIDFEIYRATAMAELRGCAALSPADREHLTKYLYEHPERYRVCTIEPLEAWRLPGAVFTVDTPDDYRAAQALAARFDDINFSVADLIESARRAV